MSYIQILETTCSSNLKSCCNDYTLAVVLSFIKNALSMIQFIVPIILIIGLARQLLKLTVNPMEKNGNQKIINRLIATVVVFMLPIVVNALVGIMPGGEGFEFAACYNEANRINAQATESRDKYIKEQADKPLTIEVETTNSGGQVVKTETTIIKGNGETKQSPNVVEQKKAETVTPSQTGSNKGQAIVNYALSFVGQRYVYGGQWNGEQPYTGTDCSGFVQGVFKHNGISLSRSTSTQWADTSKYTLVSDGNILPGDLVMYAGHVAILTGNGNEIVHAANTRRGIIISSDYKKAGCGTIKGIMRIKGVN